MIVFVLPTVLSFIQRNMPADGSFHSAKPAQEIENINIHEEVMRTYS